MKYSSNITLFILSLVLTINILDVSAQKGVFGQLVIELSESLFSFDISSSRGTVSGKALLAGIIPANCDFGTGTSGVFLNGKQGSKITFYTTQSSENYGANCTKENIITSLDTFIQDYTFIQSKGEEGYPEPPQYSGNTISIISFMKYDIELSTSCINDDTDGFYCIGQKIDNDCPILCGIEEPCTENSQCESGICATITDDENDDKLCMYTSSSYYNINTVMSVIVISIAIIALFF